MNIDFLELISDLDAKLKELQEMEPVVAAELPSDTPVGGVYVFSENGVPLYCGRTKRSIKTRVRNHFSLSAKDSPFAWRITREITGYQTQYYGDTVRARLLIDAEFSRHYAEAKLRVKNMHVQYVHEPDPIKQALLEIYVSVALKTPYNDFNTH